MRILKFKGYAKNLVILVMCMITFFPSTPIHALSEAQRKVFVSRINYFDVAVNAGCGNTAAGAPSNTLPATIPSGYADLFNKAAAAYNINPQFLAALFLNEHSNTWLPFTGPWASSPAGASGPFQFMPGTWSGYKVDGNNDGVTDIQNIYDSAFAAAKMVSDNGINATSPLGTLEKPFSLGTFVRFSAVYNWGGGNVQKKTTPESPLSAAPNETQNYMTNTFMLISSGFTKGSEKNGAVKDNSNGVTSVAGTSVTPGNNCSSGVVAGSIVQTALNFAWDTKGHGPNEADAKPSYRTAMPQYNGATAEYPFSDCGVYVSTVMIGSGADAAYPKRSTPVQLAYLQSSPKYTEIFTNNTTELQPGDIFVNTHHTYLYVGPQEGGYSIVSASLRDRVPERGGNAYFYQDGSSGEKFHIFRLKG